VILHAGLLALHGPAGWRGVMIEGPSGAGKSDLALRALDAGFALVADDRTLVWASGGHVYGRAPQTLAGRIEIRGLDVVAQPALAFCRIVLVARCGTASERIPQPAFADLAGGRLPAFDLAPLEASAPAKLRRALHHLGGGAEGAYQADRVAEFLQSAGGDTH
jgi:hypothetical protein